MKQSYIMRKEDFPEISYAEPGKPVPVLYRYTIPLAPVSKKNSQQILTNRSTGRPFIMPSSAYRRYEREAVRCLHPRPVAPIGYPVNVKCLFYMPTRRRVDLVNLMEAAHDLLVTAWILEDDNRDIIAATDGSRVYYDKLRPRTEIWITGMEDSAEHYTQWRGDRK